MLTDNGRKPEEGQKNQEHFLYYIRSFHFGMDFFHVKGKDFLI
jgi:hypothetical protein